MKFYGIDVAKEELVVASGKQIWTLKNEKESLQHWISNVPESSTFALESTNRYHRLCADLCSQAGHSVYVLNPRKVKNYREGEASRGKTDKIDARVIAQLIEEKHARLKPYVPTEAALLELKELIRYREALVKSKTQLKHGSAYGGLPQAVLKVFRRLDLAIHTLELQIQACCLSLEGYERILEIPGIGPVGASRLIYTFHTHGFANGRSAVAYAGLDIRQNQSGKRQGSGSLNKQGDAGLRKTLYLCAAAAYQTKAWQPFIDSYSMKEKFAKKQILIIVARKLLRVSWSIFHYKTPFTLDQLYTHQKAP